MVERWTPLYFGLLIHSSQLFINHNYSLLLGRSRIDIVVFCSFWSLTNCCSMVLDVRNSFLIEFFATLANHAIVFFCHVIHQSWWHYGAILWAMYQSSLLLNEPIYFCHVIWTFLWVNKFNHCFHCLPYKIGHPLWNFDN